MERDIIKKTLVVLWSDAINIYGITAFKKMEYGEVQKELFQYRTLVYLLLHGRYTLHVLCLASMWLYRYLHFRHAASVLLSFSDRNKIMSQ